MKKIFILLALFLMLGLLVGCASKPKTSIPQKSTKSTHTLNVEEQQEYQRLKQQQLTQLYWHGEETIITEEMYDEMTKHYFNVDVFEKNSDRKYFTGKITNNSDESLSFTIYVKSDYIEGSYAAPYLIKFTIQPNNSEYFTFRDISEIMIFGIYVSKGKMLHFDSRQIGRPSSENGAISKERFDYILKNHSLECFFDGTNSTFRFIEPFDYEEIFEKNKYTFLNN